MLKKLVKYGNSNALVLDKALLELLNMKEGCIVKLKTDGVSLTITPQDAIEKENVSPTITPRETLHEAAMKMSTKSTGLSPEASKAYLDEMRKAYKPYYEAMKKMGSEEVQKAIAKIKEQFKGDTSNPEYWKAIADISEQYVPELKTLSKEIQIINEKHLSTEQLGMMQPVPNSSIMQAFRDVHAKYSDVQLQVVKLNENPKYIHESVVLAEKYKATQNSPEYIKEYTELIAKYIPEYGDYQEEIKAIGESLKPKK